MFDRSGLAVAHDDLVAGVISAVRQLSQQAVVDAFLASLESRRLDLRSALGSYAVARHLEPHAFVSGPPHSGYRCATCGADEVEYELNWNILNFERFKWGGVRRDHLEYLWLDLRQFSRLKIPKTSPADRTSLDRLLGELEDAPPETTAAKAARSLLRSIPGNKAERAVLLDILGVLGVLETPEHRGYAEGFVRAEDRVLPPLRYVEQEYPACWWRLGLHGVNRAAACAYGLL